MFLLIRLAPIRFSALSYFTPIKETKWQSHIIHLKKRKKELARKLKQEQKRRRKLDKRKENPDPDIDTSHDEIENIQD